MSTVHQQIDVRCGDDWVITGIPTDQYGNPLALTGSPTFVYKIDSLDGSENFYTTTSSVTVIDSNTQIQVVVPKATTSTIPAGTYYDTLQVTSGGEAITGLEGLLNAAPVPE